MRDSKLRYDIEKIITDNIKTIPYEGDEIDKTNIIEEIFIYIKENFNGKQ